MYAPLARRPALQFLWKHLAVAAIAILIVVGIAWIIAFNRVTEIPWSPNHRDPNNRATWAQWSGLGRFYVWIRPDRNQDMEKNQSLRVSAIPAWIPHIDSVSEDYGVDSAELGATSIYTYGFPLPFMYWTERHYQLQGDPRKGGLIVRARTHEWVLPLHVVWIRLIVNIIGVWSALVLIVFVAQRCRIRLRSRHGRCIHCGYDFSGLVACENRACPECGNSILG